jgi:ligand-binding sensor domain-containing protein
MAFLKLFSAVAIFALSIQPSLGIVQTTIYAGTKAGLAISHDDGISWPKIEFKSGMVGAVTSDANGSVYIGASNGVFKTSDDQTFENITDPIATKNVRSLLTANKGEEIYAGTEYFQGNIRYTHDAGKVWGLKAIGQKNKRSCGDSRMEQYALRHWQ